MTSEQPDPTRLAQRLEQVRDLAAGLHVSFMVHLGRRLGLYQALRGAGPTTAAGLAQRTGLHQRWLLEWLRQQAAAGLLDHRGGERYELSPEAATVLADEDHLMYLGYLFDAIPDRIDTLARLPEAFRTGLGLSWDDRGGGSLATTEMTFRNWYRHLLVPMALPRLDGVVARLEAGAIAADVGCGSGVAVIEMAKAFPRSRFHGYDISAQALARAWENASAAGVTNVSFHHTADDPLPSDHSLDFATTFDCLHDMTHPLQQAARPIHAALRPDGVWFIVDIAGAETVEERLARPGAALLYAMSVLSCLSSSMSEPDGEGHGTLGLPEPALRALVEAAGFTRFRTIDLPHPVNAFYEARP